MRHTMLITIAFFGLIGCAESILSDPDAGQDDGNEDDGNENEADYPADTGPTHWSHIKVWDFGRNLQYIPDPVARAQAYDFFAARVDVAEEQAAELGRRNPSIRTFRYLIDITVCQHEGCSAANAEVPDPPGAEESFYLHFSQDTRYTLRGATVVVSGCPVTPIRACRVQTFIWTDSRFVHNPKNPAFREWMAASIATAASGDDGVFLDEHGPGLAEPIAWAGVESGGGILEYGGRRIEEIKDDYNADLSAALAVYQRALSPKFIVINGATWILEKPVIDQALAAGGVVTEFLHLPGSFDGGQHYASFLSIVDKLVAQGAQVDLYGLPCASTTGFTSGLYSSGPARFRMWRLASYYLAREETGAVGAVYFDPNFCIPFTDPAAVLDFRKEWLPAYEVDVGAPDGSRETAFQTGPGVGGCSSPYTILSRSYRSGSVLVLVRPKDAWNCADYGDDTAVTVSLSRPMRLLRDDGSLAESTSSLPLRNAEAAILFAE